MKQHKILQVRLLSESAFILRFERNGMLFVPGQHVCVGIQGDDDRPYSIYSGINDDFIEILVKEIDRGNISRKLKALNVDSYVMVDQPHGFFCIDEKIIENVELMFIATGTGIAPFHSIVKSYPDLSYHLIHGVRYINECYESEFYAKGKYISCVTRENEGHFQGRITEYIKKIDLNPDTYYYLCGNSSMVDDIFDFLQERKISRQNIRTEIYF